MTTAANTAQKIALPPLAEGASLKLNDSHNPNDVGFATRVKGDKTKQKPPLDAVCVDHAVITDKNDVAKLRCLFVVVKGESYDGKDLTGRNGCTDLSFGGDAVDYTLANLRLMGFDFGDVDAAATALAKNPGDAKLQAAATAAEDAFNARLNDPSKSGGVGVKLLNLVFEEDEFPKGSGTLMRRLALGGITQPMAKLSTDETKKKLGGLFAKMAASKDGPPKKDFNGGGAGQGNGSAGRTRNPSSPPPVIDKGTQKVDEDLPF